MDAVAVGGMNLRTGSDTIEMAALTRPLGGSGDEGGRARGSDRPTSVLPGPERKEIEALARRMHAHHPHVSLATLTALVEEADADLAGSPVQSFRMILTERAVRRRLDLRSKQA